MSIKSPVVIRPGAHYPAVVLREQEEWGFITADLVNPPRRLSGDTSAIAVELGIDAQRLIKLPTPSALLLELPEGDNWPAQSRRSIARWWSHFLISEDPQRRLDARAVSTLAHQVSLVRHVLDNPELRRVLIADEVGLGKTVEAGMIIKELLNEKANLRVLYLAPARLVTNVRREFDRLGLDFRQWTSQDSDARLSDPRIVGSIHRAVHPIHRETLLKAEPWDLLIVDECHHLSAWSPGGGDPREQFKLVRDLISRLTNNSRVILLSGTPHQGHADRFANLLRLLKSPGESDESLRGRVIYRTKDDIVDWEGNLLFPRRIVNDPLVIDLGPKYKQWIRNIHEFYHPSKENGEGSQAFRRRAAGWRCAQALQWAASSPQAGLGYLVRQAIRAGWTLDQEPLEKCILALRPYRSGPKDETSSKLFSRLLNEVARQSKDADIGDIEEDSGSESPKEAATNASLSNLLGEGLNIVEQSAHEKWKVIMEHVLLPIGNEKVVLFAQPIETVTSLAAFLEEETGERPALIVGGQSDAERDNEVSRFRQPSGPRFLVSSRAGGEGINLQVAHRLVHVDVPWNPMDMEQRVGRVHRFGSRRNIIVDTVVVKDSREADAFRIAREKLHLIAKTLVEPERFESIFSRVMCLVPPEDLQDVLIHDPLAPFTNDDQAQLAEMVREGYNKWREFDQQFSDQQRKIRQQDPGVAAWGDVSEFLQSYAKAQPVAGFTSQRFGRKDGAVEPVASSAEVIRLDDGQCYACADLGGLPVFGPNGETAAQLGLNLDPVQETIRRCAFPNRASGAAHLRWPNEVSVLPGISTSLFAVLVLVRYTVRINEYSGWSDVSSQLRHFIVDEHGQTLVVDQDHKRVIFQGLSRASVRSKPVDAALLQARLVECERDLMSDWRRPTDTELADGIRHAVAPLLSAVIEISR